MNLLLLLLGEVVLLLSQVALHPVFLEQCEVSLCVNCQRLLSNTHWKSKFGAFRHILHRKGERRVERTDLSNVHTSPDG